MRREARTVREGSIKYEDARVYATLARRPLHTNTTILGWAAAGSGLFYLIFLMDITFAHFGVFVGEADVYVKKQEDI